MPEINIAGRKVGPDYPALVIAELGINHNGCLETAKMMVDAAARAGVEVLKHQTHVPSDEMSAEAKNIIPVHTHESIYEIMEQCALSEEEETELKRYVESKGMIFISTPFSRAAADRLERMHVAAYKIGSGECNNYPLLKHIAKKGKPIILSTGMNTIESVTKAVDIFEAHDIPFALLHTTNLYPTPPHLVRLGAMVELAEKFPQAVIGLSDHTTDNIACIGATALGASILERHFTDTMDREGPDIVCSMDEHQCKELIESTKILHQELGGTKEPAEQEQSTMDFAFATVVTTQDIQKGEEFSEDNLWVKRPGSGEIKAEEYENLIGKQAATDLAPDTHLKYSDISDSQ